MKISEKLSKLINALLSEGKVDLPGQSSPEIRDELPSLSSPDIALKDLLADQRKRVSRETPMPAETVSEFNELIQRLFDEEQQTTDPWIKLGIDLGTSSSKVVWRGESDTFPVCFGDNKSLLESYLVPSVVSIEDGEIFSGFDVIGRRNQHKISNFKMCLACVSVESSKCNIEMCSLNAGWTAGLFAKALIGEEVKFVNAIFLARLLANTKQIIVSELDKKFLQTPRPRWTANLAVPEKFIEQSPVASSFQEVFRTAWVMSNVFFRYPEFSDLTSVTKCYLAARKFAVKAFKVLEKDETFGCAVYPEVGAEVASIVMNKNSDEGLYAFVDIGAGTIDASLFNYFRDGTKPNRPPFATDISKDLGAAHIEAYASVVSEHTKAGTYSAEELKEVKEKYNGMTSSEKAAVETQFRIIKYVSRKIGKDSETFLTEIFREARDKKYPGIVNQTIRLVLGGGGAALNTYRKAATEAFTSKHATDPRLPEVTILPKPDQFQMSPLPSEQFHRFAIAYGLSYPIDELPKHILAEDVLMITKSKSPDRTFNPLYD